MRARFFPELGDRLQSEWRLKVSLFIAINLLFWLGYQTLARHAFFPQRAVPTTWLDQVVPFQPQFWAWVYCSQFVATGGLPLLLTQRSHIWRYVTSVGIMTSVSFVVFFLLPTQAPRTELVDTGFLMRRIATVDGPLNAMPSLHAAFVVCMGRLAYRMFGRKTILPALLWGGAIFFSTLATKQHYALDLIAGAALGWVADVVAWRRSTAAEMIPANNDDASQGGVR